MITYFFGSTSDDFDQAAENHPFPPCPDTPNCVIHSVEYQASEMEMFEAVKSAITQLSPYKSEINSQSLQIDAVFRIPIFGFMDDVSIMVRQTGSQKSILYIKSASRVGRNDFGVNRRRIKRILSSINQQL